MPELIDRLPEYRKQLDELDEKLSKEALNDMKLYKTLMQERAHLAPIVEKLEEMKGLEKDIEDSKEMLRTETDTELVEMAKEELAALESALESAEKECRILLIPPDLWRWQRKSLQLWKARLRVRKRNAEYSSFHQIRLRART